MYQEAKIKIDDNTGLRELLYSIFDRCDQVVIAQWAIALSKHIFSIIDVAYEMNTVITDGYMLNEKWQNSNARMYDVRQAGFAVHKLAKETHNILEQTGYRVAGQAIGTGHMKEHGMVASDYAIKAINLKYPNSIIEVENERRWQINALEKKYNEIENSINGNIYDWEVIEDNSRLHVDQNDKSQTIMYLSKKQLVRRIDKETDNNEMGNWIKIETKTKKTGYCKSKNVKQMK